MGGSLLQTVTSSSGGCAKRAPAGRVHAPKGCGRIATLAARLGISRIDAEMAIALITHQAAGGPQSEGMKHGVLRR